MKHTHRIFVRLGFLFMAIAVGLGAFGAHGLKDLIEDEYIAVWETSVRYLIIHASALILLGLMHRKFNVKKLNLALYLFISGIIVFSGSLLLLATSEIWAGEKLVFLGAITPLGGVAFIAGWFILFLKGFGVEKDKGGISESVLKNASSNSRRRRRHRSDRANSNNPNEKEATEKD